MINENGIILEKTDSPKVSFVRVLTSNAIRKAVIYGKKRFNLLYVYNFNFKESKSDKNIYLVKDFYPVDRFEYLNTKEKILSALFILDVASQIDINYDFFLEIIQLLKENEPKSVLVIFIQKILLENGVNKGTKSNLDSLILDLENYLERKIKVNINEIFNSAC